MRVVAFFNTLLLYFLVFVLCISFMEQYYYGEAPCPLCVLQRFFLIAAGVSLTFNITWKLYFKNMGLGILACILGSVISLYQWSLLLINDGVSSAPKILSQPMYIWAALMFFSVSIYLFILLFIMDSEKSLRVCTYTKVAYGLFFTISVISVVSTFISCGFYLC